MSFRSLHAAPWIAALARRKATVFASLFFLSAIAQTILLTVIPLEALRTLGGARAVSLLYFGVSIAGLFGRLGIPWLARLVRRRSVFTLGAILLAVAAALLATGTFSGLLLGLTLNIFALACVEVTLNLYVLDHIPRHELGRFEPTRIFAAAAPWTLAPWLGVYLEQSVASVLPFAIAGTAALLLLALFWALRLGENTVLQAMRRPPPNPVRYLRRYFAQPRLRLAWLLAAGRASWWNMFFVYAPIFAVTAKLGAEAGGAIVSLGSAWMWSVPLWGWLGRRYGLRRLLLAGYAAAGVLTLAAALSTALPPLGAVMLVLAALGAETLDGAGNLLFLRAVHPYERAEMTTVFVSYRDLAQLAPPAAFSVLLSLFSLPSVFVAGGLMMLALATQARHIPRRL
ncbi:MAG TPA: MFS transporter [Alphaproteobacteria bacterium]|nr:MFS transporter [Alphaproteobacteria bacterium]